MKSTVQVLEDLAANGWVPLRSMSVLLGYTHATGVYSRQRGKNPIPTVRIGGTLRVYEDAVLATLRKLAEREPEDAGMIISMYRQIQKREKDNAG